MMAPAASPPTTPGPPWPPQRACACCGTATAATAIAAAASKAVRVLVMHIPRLRLISSLTRERLAQAVVPARGNACSSGLHGIDLVNETHTRERRHDGDR